MLVLNHALLTDTVQGWPARRLSGAAIKEEPCIDKTKHFYIISYFLTSVHRTDIGQFQVVMSLRARCFKTSFTVSL